MSEADDIFDRPENMDEAIKSGFFDNTEKNLAIVALTICREQRDKFEDRAEKSESKVAELESQIEKLREQLAGKDI